MIWRSLRLLLLDTCQKSGTWIFKRRLFLGGPTERHDKAWMIKWREHPFLLRTMKWSNAKSSSVQSDQRIDGKQASTPLFCCPPPTFRSKLHWNNVMLIITYIETRFHDAVPTSMIIRTSHDYRDSMKKGRRRFWSTYPSPLWPMQLKGCITELLDQYQLEWRTNYTEPKKEAKL